MTDLISSTEIFTANHSSTEYKNPSVGDLAWLILSPKLFDNSLGPFPAFDPQINLTQTKAWLDKLDNDVLSVNVPLRQGFRRLGLYCEALFEFFFKNSQAHDLSPYDFVARNIRLFDNKITLGELDFLLCDRDSREVVHVELAVKFFLQKHANAQQWKDWVGPNARDRLDLKLTRMIDHQLQLPHRYENNSALLSLMDKHTLKWPVHSRHFVKGALFSHKDSVQEKSLPSESTRVHSQGLWQKLHEIEKNDADSFRLCEKMTWLTPLHHADETAHASEPYRVEELMARVEAIHDRSRKNLKWQIPGVLTVKKNVDGDLSQLMIVADYWPATSTPSRKI